MQVTIINLASQPTRWAEVGPQFAAAGLDVVRHGAVEGSRMGGDDAARFCRNLGGTGGFCAACPVDRRSRSDARALHGRRRFVRDESIVRTLALLLHATDRRLSAPVRHFRREVYPETRQPRACVTPPSTTSVEPIT